MSAGEGALPALARTGHRRSEAAPIELFFDLAAQTVVVFAAVWWGWNYTTWARELPDGVRLLIGRRGVG